MWRARAPLWVLCGLWACAWDVLQVHASAGELQVRVNRVHVSAAVAVDSQSVVKRVRYKFAADDRADVWCLRWWVACDLRLTYHFLHERVGDISAISDKYQTNTRHSWVGVRASLRAAHHGSRVTCRCARGNRSAAIQLTLVRDETFYDVLEVKVNSETLRYRKLSSRPDYPLSYAYEQKEPVTVECITNVTNAVVHVYKHNMTTICLPDTKLTLRPGNSELPPDKTTRLYCVAKNVTNHQLDPLRIVTLYLTPFYFEIDVHDPTPLTVNTSGRGSLLELYRPRREQLVYYEFEVGDSLYFTCSTSAGVLRKYKYALMFDDTVESRQDSIVTQITFSSRDEHRTLNCSLLNKRDNVTVRNICVVFLRKSIDSGMEEIRTTTHATTTLTGTCAGDGAGEDESCVPTSTSRAMSDVTVAAAGAGAAAVLVVAALTAAVCWRRARTRRCAAAGTAAPTTLAAIDTDNVQHKMETTATGISGPGGPLATNTSKQYVYEYVYAGNEYCEIQDSQPPATTTNTTVEEPGASAYDYAYCHSGTYHGSGAVPPAAISEDPSKIYDYAYCGHAL